LIIVEPEGAEMIRAVTVIVSEVPEVVAIVAVTGIDAAVVAPTRTGGNVPTVSAETARFAADAGATDVRTPRPKAATATSAMRLKVVFVDICFLSISRSEEFPPLGFG